MAIKKGFTLFISKVILVILVFLLPIGLSVFYWTKLENLAAASYYSVYEKTNHFLLKNGFGIEKVLISGNKLVAKSAIKDVIPTNESLLFASSHGVAEALTYVNGVFKSVSVAKELPNTIRIYVVEYNPFASICSSNNQCNIVDEDGYLISQAHRYNIENLVNVFGEKVRREDLKLIKNILENDGKFAGSIEKFEQVGLRRWDIVFKNGLRVKLPENKPLASWASFISMKNSLVEHSNVVDMRISDRVFFSRDTSE